MKYSVDNYPRAIVESDSEKASEVVLYARAAMSKAPNVITATNPILQVPCMHGDFKKRIPG